MLMLPYIYEISREGDTIRLFQEYAKIDRPVVLGSTEPNVTDPTFGQRTARFENDALVVESSGFPAHSAGLASGWEPNGNGADIPASEQKALTERYTVNDDGSQLTLRYTVSDPAYLSKPYSAEIVWHRIPDNSPIYDFTCDAEIAMRSTRNVAILQE